MKRAFFGLKDTIPKFSVETWKKPKGFERGQERSSRAFVGLGRSRRGVGRLGRRLEGF